DVLTDEGVSYNDIVILSRDAQGSVTSLETDIVKLNTLKSLISNRLSQIVASEEDYVIQIPVGSFFSTVYTGGWGPQIPLKMRLTATAHVNFSHEFRAAGINQVLHIVMIDMDIYGSLVVPGGRNAVSVSTSVFAAQTIIAGIVPGAYTQVLEDGETEDIAGLINDYGADEK
ncbi:MAG: sporulation protein YunB, partial [Clostridia bacterium]|nr:sporulation protein YunB [Clostridia bacterium]